MDISKQAVEAGRLVDQNMPDTQIRAQAHISQTAFDRIHATEAQEVNS